VFYFWLLYFPALITHKNNKNIFDSGRLRPLAGIYFERLLFLLNTSAGEIVDSTEAGIVGCSLAGSDTK